MSEPFQQQGQGPFPERGPAALPELPAELDPARSDLLLKYQKAGLRLMDSTALLVVEKSRRIGFTWAVAFKAVTTAGKRRAAGGMDVLYIGYNLDMAREFIDTCAMWARTIHQAASEVEETVFGDDRDPEKSIKAFRITFKDFDIVALPSTPRSLRGRQGMVIFDEAAFHDDLGELLKAALALLMWGGRVVVISTHNGQDNPFNELIGEIRTKKRRGGVFTVTLADALKDGLYERICLVTGRDATPEGRAEWEAEVRGSYGDAAGEELDCIPRRGGGVVLPLALIEAAVDPEAQVFRLTCKDAFALADAGTRAAEVQAWCEAHLLEPLEALSKDLPSFFGEDFGRTSDRTVIWPMQVTKNLFRKTPFTVEMLNVPFEQQRQVLFYIVDLLPRFTKGALDEGGNGAYLAEVAWQRYGEHRIEKVKLSQEWYRENMPAFVAAFEDTHLSIPQDLDTRDDLRQLKRLDGIIRLPALRTKAHADAGLRHGDAAIAGALGYYATLAPVEEYDYTPARIPGRAMAIAGGARAPRAMMRAEDWDDDDGAGDGAWKEGAW